MLLVRAMVFIPDKQQKRAFTGSKFRGVGSYAHRDFAGNILHVQSAAQWGPVLSQIFPPTLQFCPELEYKVFRHYPYRPRRLVVKTFASRTFRAMWYDRYRILPATTSEYFAK